MAGRNFSRIYVVHFQGGEHPVPARTHAGVDNICAAPQLSTHNGFAVVDAGVSRGVAQHGDSH